MGGDRRLLPAAARAARRGRAADAVADAGAVRPARSGRDRRALRRVRGRGAPRHATRRTPPGCAPAATSSSRASSSARGATTSGRSASLRDARRRPARGAGARTRSGPPRRPTRCCRCWRPTPACGLQVQTGVDAHRRRFGEGWRGGFWLPECAYAPWLARRARGRRRARRLRRADRPLRPRRRRASAAASRPRPACVLVPIDRATISLVWSDARLSGERRLPRLPPPHGPPPQPRGATTATRTTTSAALALAREHAADFVARTLARLREAGARRRRVAAGRRAGRVRARHRAARALVV